MWGILERECNREMFLSAAKRIGRTLLIVAARPCTINRLPSEPMDGNSVTDGGFFTTACILRGHGEHRTLIQSNDDSGCHHCNGHAQEDTESSIV
jgi:hypothetical protein